MLFELLFIVVKMKQITLELTKSNKTEIEITEDVEVLEIKNYYLSLSRSLKKAQDGFNSFLTEIVDKNKKRSGGNSGEVW